MVRPFPAHVTDHIQSAPLATGLMISIFALVALCAKRSTKSPKGPSDDNNNDDLLDTKSSNGVQVNYNKATKSVLSTPKRLLSNISNLSLKSSKKSTSDQKENEDDITEEAKDTFINDMEGGGLWQKNILMGEKCQPLEYSGVIYYDNHGHRTSEIPRSPRVSGAISQRGSFSLPSVANDSSIDVHSSST